MRSFLGKVKLNSCHLFYGIYNMQALLKHQNIFVLMRLPTNLQYSLSSKLSTSETSEN